MKTLLYLLVMLVLSSSVEARNSFLVAPGRVDIDLSRPKTQSFIITNNGDEKIRLSINPVYFPVNSKSLAAGEPLGDYKEGHDDLSEFVRVSPRTLSLQPGQRRDIRISVRSRGKLEAGDYRAHLLVSMLENALTLVSSNSAQDNTMGMKLNIKLETGVALYGHMGVRDPSIEFVCEADDNDNLIVKAINSSPWLFTGQVSMYRKGQINNTGKLFEYQLRSIRNSTTRKETNVKYSGIGRLDIHWGDLNDERINHISECRFVSP